MKIFLISPVRNVTKEERKEIEKYVVKLEAQGHSVHWPERDTDQNDPVGLRICRDNRKAMEGADEIHIWWNKKSEGSLFDFGIAFALKKKIVLVNKSSIRSTPEKSFNNVLLTLHNESNQGKIKTKETDTELKTVFLIGKYFSKDFNEIEENIQLAEKYAIKLWNLGFGVFTPHLNTRHFEVKTRVPEEVYQAFDRMVIERLCHCGFVLPNWTSSKGAKKEVKLFNRLGKPVFKDFESICNWRDGKKNNIQP